MYRIPEIDFTEYMNDMKIIKFLHCIEKKNEIGAFQKGSKWQMSSYLIG